MKSLKETRFGRKRGFAPTNKHYETKTVTIIFVDRSNGGVVFY
jgi:hypothetical protein